MHEIQAFIGNEQYLRGQTQKNEHACIIALAQGFAMLPLNEALSGYDIDASSSENFEEFYNLTPHVLGLGKMLSIEQPVAYVETEYWGGDGTQAAIVWHEGRTVFRPHTGLLSWRRKGVQNLPTGCGAISLALNRMGVIVNEEHDEFDALGLGRFRSNEDWIAQCIQKD